MRTMNPMRIPAVTTEMFIADQLASNYDVVEPESYRIGESDDCDWSEIEGRAAECGREDGDVTYRGVYICTAWNDEDGGDIVDADGNPMTEKDIANVCRKIDTEKNQ